MLSNVALFLNGALQRVFSFCVVLIAVNRAAFYSVLRTESFNLNNQVCTNRLPIDGIERHSKLSRFDLPDIGHGEDSFGLWSACSCS